MVAADEVSIKVTGQNTSTPAVDSARRDMKGLKDEAGETSVKVRVLGESVSSTTRKTDDLGDKARRATRELSALDRKILELRASTLALGRQFEATGDTSLLKKFRADSRELSGLERMRKQVAGLTGDVKDLGKEAGSTFSTFASFVQGGILKALFTPAGAAAAAPALIGGTITAGGVAGGALTAGVGAGVAGAGVAGAAMQSKAVQGEWAHTTAVIKQQYLDATTSFEGPALAAIHRIGGAVREVHMDKIFGDATKFVDPLSRGVASAVGSFGRGVEEMVSKGEPAVVALGDAVADVGRGVEVALKEISDGSEGGAVAIRDLGEAIYVVTAGTGKFVGWLEEAYGWLKKTQGAAAEYHPFIGFMSDEPQVIARRLKETGEAGQEAFRGIDERARDALATVDRLNTGFEHMFGILMSVDEATIRYQQSIDDLASNWDRAGKSLDANSQAGRDNLRLIEDVIRAIDAQREAAIRAGGGTQEAYDAANGAYLQQLKNLRSQLVALGANTAAVDALIAKYEELAKPLTKTITVKVLQIGSVSSEGVVSGGDPRRNRNAAYAKGGITGAASGMVLSGLADVAEQGREIALLAPGRAVLPPGSQVLSNANTEQALARGGGAGEAREVVLRLEGGAGDVLLEALETALRIGKLRAFAKA